MSSEVPTKRDEGVYLIRKSPYNEPRDVGVFLYYRAGLARGIPINGTAMHVIDWQPQWVDEGYFVRVRGSRSRLVKLLAERRALDEEIQAEMKKIDERRDEGRITV